MLAFIHIEKAAGQTFTRILENNYVIRHCRVAPLNKKHLGVFNWDDLKMLLRVNPFLCAISGHSIAAYSDLADHLPGIRYITLLRDPVERYISQYQYWVQVLKKEISFENFLSLEDIHNFQTKKIAGSSDLFAAKSIINEKIFLTGIVEEFDDFLIVLRDKLAQRYFDIKYTRKNVAKSYLIKNRITQKYEKYKERIYCNNRLDIELYKFVKYNTFPKEKVKFVKTGKNHIGNGENKLFLKFYREIIGRIYRNLYIGPFINMIRLKNGLKIGGSY